MRYAVRYFRDATPELAGSSIPTLFLIARLRSAPSGECVRRLVRDHAARHGWVARGDEEAVHILEGEVRAARELLGVQVRDANDAVICMKLQDGGPAGSERQAGGPQAPAAG